MLWNFFYPIFRFFSYDPHHRSGRSARSAYDEDDDEAHPRGMQCQTH